MTPEQNKLKDVLRKVTSNMPLTVAESNFIKETYRSLQGEYEKVLEDSSEDEIKVIAIQSALQSLQAKKISGPEFVSEVIYSIHVLKDKRKRDRMLRSETSGSPRSAATASAMRLFPMPGGPAKIIPVGKVSAAMQSRM